MNPKEGFDFNVCGHFLIKVEGGAKNYKRELPLPILYRRIRAAKGYYSFQNEKKNSTREVGFHLPLKLKKRCIVGKKRATEVS